MRTELFIKTIHIKSRNHVLFNKVLINFYQRLFGKNHSSRVRRDPIGALLGHLKKQFTFVDGVFHVLKHKENSPGKGLLRFMAEPPRGCDYEEPSEEPGCAFPRTSDSHCRWLCLLQVSLLQAFIMN